MEVSSNEDYTLINFSLTNFEKEIKDFEEYYIKTNKNHIIITFSNEEDIDNEKISLLSHYAEQQIINEKSFIIVCKTVNIDDFSEDLNIVPTINEAKDVLEMENIERDLLSS